jgi:hypothetical protein
MTNFHFAGVEPQRGECRWTVKENANGTPFLFGEPTGVPLKIIGPTGEDLEVGFELAPGTTIDEAHSLARVMNSRITHIALIAVSASEN